MDLQFLPTNFYLLKLIMIITIIIIFRQPRKKSIQSRSGILKSSCFEKLELSPEKIQKQSPGDVL